ITFAESGTEVGTGRVAGSSFFTRQDKQNTKTTLKLINSKTGEVVGVANGEGAYEDTQANFNGPNVGRSQSRSVLSSFKEALNQLVGQVRNIQPIPAQAEVVNTIEDKSPPPKRKK
ncbi:MAG: hypothetical protein WCL27_06590, partial [Betaproteobacteria bacterium]